MREEARLLMTIWDGLETIIPTKEKANAARIIVEAFTDMGHDARDLYDLEGEDDYIDDALAAKLDDEDDVLDLMGGE